LLDIKPLDDELVEDGGGAASVELAAVRAGGPSEVGYPQPQQQPVWVESTSGRFVPSTHDAQRQMDMGDTMEKRSMLSVFGVGRQPGVLGMPITAASQEARGGLMGVLRIAEGCLAGMSLMHAVVTEQTSDETFLVVVVFASAGTMHALFHFFSTLAVMSAAAAAEAASFRLMLSDQQVPGHRLSSVGRSDMMHQRSASAVAAALYAASLVLTLVVARTDLPWSRLNTAALLALDPGEAQAFREASIVPQLPQWQGLACSSHARAAIAGVRKLLTRAAAHPRDLPACSRCARSCEPCRLAHQHERNCPPCRPV